jgi:hypothetical protein
MEVRGQLHTPAVLSSGKQPKFAMNKSLYNGPQSDNKKVNNILLWAHNCDHVSNLEHVSLRNAAARTAVL